MKGLGDSQGACDPGQAGQHQETLRKTQVDREPREGHHIRPSGCGEAPGGLNPARGVRAWGGWVSGEKPRARGGPAQPCLGVPICKTR